MAHLHIRQSTTYSLGILWRKEIGLSFCQQCFGKVIWGHNVRHWWHDGSFYYCKNGALLLLSGSWSFFANSGSSEAACICRAAQMDSDRQFRSSAHYSNKTAEQRNPLLALCNPSQSHQIISAERYMTNTQEGWRKRKEDGQRHRGMKELYNRITERSVHVTDGTVISSDMLHGEGCWDWHNTHPHPHQHVCSVWDCMGH